MQKSHDCVFKIRDCIFSVSSRVDLKSTLLLRRWVFWVSKNPLFIVLNWKLTVTNFTFLQEDYLSSCAVPPHNNVLRLKHAWYVPAWAVSVILITFLISVLYFYLALMEKKRIILRVLQQSDSQIMVVRIQSQHSVIIVASFVIERGIEKTVFSLSLPCIQGKKIDDNQLN